LTARNHSSVPCLELLSSPQPSLLYIINTINTESKHTLDLHNEYPSLLPKDLGVILEIFSDFAFTGKLCHFV
jgi:hypothetical protein